MAMFARRSLQRMLDHLADHLPFEARKKLAHELNRQAVSALGFEWEIALLYALSTVGKVGYEENSASKGPRPDLAFLAADEPPLRFIADVATVSDEGLDAENPVTRFSIALSRLRQKYRLSGSTHFEIKGDATGPHFKNRKMRLHLPPASKIEALLQKHAAPVFKTISENNLRTATIPIHEPGVDVTITYDADRRYGGGTYPSYTAAYSLTRNPVFTSLKAKAQQLKKINTDFPRGIFLCDGGCTLLKNTRRHVESASIDQVINEFFRQNSSISFVAVLVFPPTRTEAFSGIVKEQRITGNLYVNSRAKRPIDREAFLKAVNLGLSALPKPSATPTDALRWLANEPANEGMTINRITYGGNLMSQSLKISSRNVQKLLAGQLTPDQLFDDYKQPGSQFENPFLRALKQGLMIEAIAVLPVPESDDDLLEFRFGPADPAIRKLTVVQK